VQRAPVSYSNFRGVGIIALSHDAGDFGAEAADALACAVGECARSSCRTILLLMTRSSASSPAIETSKVTEVEQGPQIHRILLSMYEVAQLACPLVAVVDGCISALGTCVMAVSDLVIATADSQCKLPCKTGKLFPHCCTSISARRAQQAGIITDVVEDTVALVTKGSKLIDGLMQRSSQDLMKSKSVRHHLCSILADVWLDMLEPSFVPGGAPGIPKFDAPGVPEFNDPPVPITTLKLSNLPGFFDQKQLLCIVDALGFKGKYDLLHVLPGSQNGAHTKSNLSCGFINFTSSRDAEAFAAAFGGFQSKHSDTLKTCAMTAAHVQGFHGTLELLNYLWGKGGFTGSIDCSI